MPVPRGWGGPAPLGMRRGSTPALGARIREKALAAVDAGPGPMGRAIDAFVEFSSGEVDPTLNSSRQPGFHSLGTAQKGTWKAIYSAEGLVSAESLWKCTTVGTITGWEARPTGSSRATVKIEFKRAE